MALTVGLLGLAALSSGSSIPLSVFRRFVGSQARDLSVGGGWWWRTLKQHVFSTVRVLTRGLVNGLPLL